MAISNSGFSFDTGQLTASRQGDALLGYGGGVAGGLDEQGMIDKILAERRRKEVMEANQQRKALQMAQRMNRPTIADQNLQHAQNSAQIARARAETAQARALTERGPQRYIFGLGYAGGPNQTQQDIARMTGAQRQALLPKESGFAPGEGEKEMASQQRRALQDQQWWDSNKNENKQLRSNLLLNGR